MIPRTMVRPVWVMASAAAMLLSGCATDQPRQLPPAAQAAPADTPVERMLVSTDKFSKDQNGNGFYDTFMCVVYLFAPDQSAIPMHSPGRMTFELNDEENYTIARWSVSEDALARIAGVYSGLPGYFLSLNIADVGDDRIISKRAELTCTFYPADGGPSVRASPVPVQQVGPISAGSLRR